jgi:hypothetical protein
MVGTINKFPKVGSLILNNFNKYQYFPARPPFVFAQTFCQLFCINIQYWIPCTMSHNLYSCRLTQAKNVEEQRSSQKKFLAINEVSHQGGPSLLVGGRGVIGVGFLLLPMYSIKFSQCSSTSQCVFPHHVPNNTSLYPIPFGAKFSSSNLYNQHTRRRLSYIYFGNVQSLLIFW